MGRMTGRLRIARPAPEVFDRALDEPSWNPAMTGLEWRTPPPIGTGSQYRAVLGRLPTTVEITEFARPQRLATRTSSSWLRTEGTVTFTEDVPGATVLRWDWHYQLRGAARLLSPLFALIGPRWERRNWERLRDAVEGPA